ncbi:hypothetical protein Trydic_g22235 [Trypoxylus dichotomus]
MHFSRILDEKKEDNCTRKGFTYNRLLYELSSPFHLKLYTKISDPEINRPLNNRISYLPRPILIGIPVKSETLAVKLNVGVSRAALAANRLEKCTYVCK